MSYGLKEPSYHVLDEDRANPFAAARDDKSAMRPFAKLLWTLVPNTVIPVHTVQTDLDDVNENKKAIVLLG